MKAVYLIGDVLMFVMAALCIYQGLRSPMEGGKLLYFGVSMILGYQVSGQKGER